MGHIPEIMKKKPCGVPDLKDDQSEHNKVVNMIVPIMINSHWLSILGVLYTCK